MNIRQLLPAASLGLLLSVPAAVADEPATKSSPPPVPVTREDMKRALEASKRNVPRLPLPEPTQEEQAQAESAAKARAQEAARSGKPDTVGRAMGGGIVNNGRMRALYLAEYGLNRAGSRPGQGSDSGLSPAFTTMLFWITSRGNNCTYCMGHQEVKLAAAGLSDDQIAALDGDWSEYSDRDRAAFAFTKKLTYEPHAMADADIASLRPHFNDVEILDILISVAGFNATNRWTGALRIPQEDHREFLTPTSATYASKTSRVAPLSATKTVGLVAPQPRRRPALETRAEVQTALAAAETRNPRLPLADDAAVRAAISEQAGEAPPQWMRLLCTLPRSGASRVASTLAAETQGTLDPKTKSLIAWVCARNDRAWYALGHARNRLRTLGLSDDQIFAMDDPESIHDPAEREVVRFARTIAVDPAMICDDDIANLRKHFNDKQVAEIVHQATQAAFFNRLTEAAGLRLER